MADLHIYSIISPSPTQQHIGLSQMKNVGECVEIVLLCLVLVLQLVQESKLNGVE